jgi:hypothetical protein
MCTHFDTFLVTRDDEGFTWHATLESGDPPLPIKFSRHSIYVYYMNSFCMPQPHCKVNVREDFVGCLGLTQLGTSAILIGLI